MTEAANKTICAVIISYEPDEALVRLYDSVKQQADEIIIIDNASRSEQSKKILLGLSEKTKVIFNEQNYGISKALNQGALYAIKNNYKWLLTLDQDSEFIHGTYDLLLKAYETLPDTEKTVLIAPSYIEKVDIKPNETFSLPAIEKIKWKDKTLVITSGSLIKTEAFASVGFFEEKLFIDKVDLDFCFKLRKNGFKCKTAENLNFMHEIGKPVYKLFFKIANLSAQRRYYSSKNAVYMLKTYFGYAPFSMMFLLLKSSVLLAPLKILLFEKQKFIKIKNIYKGFIDGLLNRY